MRSKKNTISGSSYVFETAFGWCSVSIRDNVVTSVILPGISSAAELKGVNTAPSEINTFEMDVVTRISRYYEGNIVEFGDIAVELPFGSEFARKIFQACREIPYGKVVSYSELAEMAGVPGTARVVGNILGRNPVPLIIPCHRVIKADGKIGGFMRNIEGASIVKQRMIELETKMNI